MSIKYKNIMKHIKKVFEGEELNRSWKTKDRSLMREFEFNSFLEALEFINKIAIISEEINHHPDIIWNYTKVIIESKTYEVDRITDKDYELAQRIDEL
jgi:4a-hydroxytetrahydrobiopterin dehydratase